MPHTFGEFAPVNFATAATFCGMYLMFRDLELSAWQIENLTALSLFRFI